MTDKRKFERWPARLEVEIRTRGRGQVCPSVNVSRHGMYLSTANPPHERQLLILRIPLPDGRAPIDVMASVVRRVSAEESPGPDIPPGMGINFFALTEENKGRWENYLGALRGHAPRAATAADSSSRPTFLLQPKDVERLRLFEAREFALGSMFLRTPVLRALEETLKVVLLHPVSDEEFALLARVRQVHPGSQDAAENPKGMTLDFLPMSNEVRLAFHAFVEFGVPLSEALLEAQAPGPAPIAAADPPGEPRVAPAVRPPPLPPRRPSEPPAPPATPAEEAISDDLAEAAAGIFAPPESIQKTRPPAAGDAPSAGAATAATLEDDGLDRAIARLGENEASTHDPLATPESLATVQPKVESAPPPAPPSETPLSAGLRSALERAPEDVGLLFRLGNLLARHPATAAEATQLLRRLSTLEPHHPLVNGALALAYAQLGERATATSHLTRARRLGQPIDEQLAALLAPGVN